MVTDQDFILNPDEWPYWPVLPVVTKRNEGWPVCGLVAADGKPTVYLINLGDIAERPGRTWGEKLSGVEQKDYQTFDELLSDWRVD